MGDFKTVANLIPKQICKEKITNSRLEGIISKAEENNDTFLFGFLFHRNDDYEHVDDLYWPDPDNDDHNREASHINEMRYVEYSEHSEPHVSHTAHTAHTETIYTESTYSEGPYYTDSDKERCDHSESVHLDKG